MPAVFGTTATILPVLVVNHHWGVWPASIVAVLAALVVGVVLAAGFAYLMVFTPLGRHMRFVGASREVSRLSGVRVNRIRFGSFVAAATLSGGVPVLVVTISTLLAADPPSRPHGGQLPGAQQDALPPVVLRVVDVLPRRIRHGAVRLSWGAVPVMIT